MIQLRRDDGIWVTFYPILQLDLAGEGDKFEERTLSEMGNRIYGKYVGGVSGYQPWWVYTTVKKSILREVKNP